MFLTGLAPLALALGAVPVVLLSAAGVSAWAATTVWILLVASLIAVDVALAPDPRRIRIARSIPAKARLDEAVQTQLTLISDLPRRVRLAVRDAWQPTAGAPHERPRVAIGPRESRTIQIPLLPRRRGELASEFVVLRTSGPLGLAGRQAQLADRGAIRVLPPFRAKRHLASRVQRLRELDGATSLQVRGQGTEFDSLREYVRGDDVRSIDWRATARAGSTMLRTWRPERDRHVTIVIDSGRTAAARVDDETRLDATFEAALLLAALAQRAGDHVHLLAYDRTARARVSGIDGSALLPALADALSDVEPQLIDTDWDRALAEAHRLTRRPSLLVILTAQEALGASRGFLQALSREPSAGTTVLVGTVTDAGLASTARTSGGVSDLMLAAAAERTIAEADEVARAVGRTGAEAIADTPEQLPPRIADRYLALKKAGRL